MASGTGKTTVTAGILAALRKRNLSVASFKVGPDYIDPGYHEMVSGGSCHNLDSWIIGKEEVAGLFCRTARKADISVIEGVMGLYDGGKKGISSTAEIAKLIDAPVILVIDAKSMGASAAAVALGFRDYDKDVNFAGVILNRLGSESHEQMIREAMKKANIKVLGAVRRNEDLHLPSRHLGLVPANETGNERNLSEVFCAIENQIDIDEIINIAMGAKAVESVDSAIDKNGIRDVKIAVAKDEAFSFYYEDSLAVLEEFGAEITEFSPLYDEKIPECQGIILGGGYPEMFAQKLEENESMRNSIKKAVRNGVPVYAECGGFMYLMESIEDLSGKSFNMTGVIPSKAKMEPKLQTVGYVEAEQLQDTIFGKKGLKFRGHEFHFSIEEGGGNSHAFMIEKIRTGAKYFEGFAEKNILGSYLHLHFRGSKDAAKNFVESCRKYKNG
ncbi:MAG: cobyrinate a,c-diamide synthase [Selenomonadaceae bacterium]|nr:cobyrinate a,c-diamide synthase [Selenomonadaceae bacterium]